MGRPFRKTLSTAVLATAAALILPVASSQADVVHSDGCTPAGPFSQPFLALGDSNTYEPVDGSYSLTAGVEQTTPMVCVNLDNPSVRFNLSGTPGTVVHVAAVFPAADPGRAEHPVGPVTATATTSVSPELTIPQRPGWRDRAVGLEFIARHGDAQVDSVYVDPYNHCC